MSVSIEGRFEAYCQPIVAALAHADREQPAQWYLTGLMLPRRAQERGADGRPSVSAECALGASVDASLGIDSGLG